MKSIVTLTRQDLELINNIVSENDIEGTFNIIMTTGSGIGVTTDIEFRQEVNGRDATIRIEVSGVENW